MIGSRCSTGRYNMGIGSFPACSPSLSRAMIRYPTVAEDGRQQGPDPHLTSADFPDIDTTALV